MKHLLSGIDNRIRDVRKGSHSHDFKCRKFSMDSLNSTGKTGHIAILGCGIHIFQALRCAIQVQAAFEFIKRGKTGLNILFKLLVVKPHLDNSFINCLAHSLVTSFHASFAILSKIGWIAGLI